MGRYVVDAISPLTPAEARVQLRSGLAGESMLGGISALVRSSG